ncbi:MAG: dihydrodipicolinate reductase C-terminal domain-containing protein [Candidatus Wolfebacteria bacterium]|nr:dihydrodipicolinate reductase C-terminal domain-containing protein [Candidatus Wolfebacteria bacterium]
MGILLAGHGEMARALRKECVLREVEVRQFDAGDPSPYVGGTVAVHFGSGRELPALLELCSTYQIPLIQGSTRQTLPRPVGTVVVDAPNLALPVVKLLGVLPALRDAFLPFSRFPLEGMEACIVESHQSAKDPSPSGTAVRIAEYLGLSEEDIRPIRDAETQLALGVSEEHLLGHAYHWIIFTYHGVTVQVKVSVHGRSPYAKGALVVASALVCHPERFSPGVYSVQEVLEVLGRG